MPGLNNILPRDRSHRDQERTNRCLRKRTAATISKVLTTSPEESDSDELDTRARTTGTSSEELATRSGMSCQEVSQSRRNVAANVRWRKRATHLSQSLRCQWRTKFNTRTARRETVFNMSRYHKSNACRVRYCFLHLSTNLDLDRSSVQSFAVRCLHKRKLIRVRCSRILRLM